MAVLIAHASISENNSVNGAKGDQTGKEVCVRSWYNKPWNVMIRFTDVSMAEKVADCMEKACANDKIGYSQNTRNTLLNESRKYGYDVSKVNVPVNTDCSALVSVACMYAGVSEKALVTNGNCATTRTIKKALKATGEVEIYTTPQYVNSTDRLKRGDILLKEGAHIVVVVKVENNLKSVDEIAHEVIAGKWGNGQARRANLMSAGYNYSIVMERVNQILKAKPKKEISDKPKYIWDFLLSKIGNPYGVAGLMGNLQAESGLNPQNLQNSQEKKLRMSDSQYTKAVDNGSYKNFATDKAGYGIAQWTSSGRKEALLKSKGTASIGDLDVQLNYLWKELSTAYKSVLECLKTAMSVRESSDVVLTKFERPKDQSEAVKSRRAAYGQQFFDKFNGGKV